MPRVSIPRERTRWKLYWLYKPTLWSWLGNVIPQHSIHWGSYKGPLSFKGREIIFTSWWQGNRRTFGIQNTDAAIFAKYTLSVCHLATTIHIPSTYSPFPQKPLNCHLVKFHLWPQTLLEAQDPLNLTQAQGWEGHDSGAAVLSPAYFCIHIQGPPPSSYHTKFHAIISQKLGWYTKTGPNQVWQSVRIQHGIQVSPRSSLLQQRTGMKTYYRVESQLGAGHVY